MQAEFWPSTGPTSDDGETSRRLFPTPRASDAERGGRGELLHVAKGAPTPRGPLNGGSTSSLVGSPAKTSRTRVQGRASRASGPDSGTSSPASFARWSPDTFSWRTCQLSLLGGWIPYSGRWPRSGTMRNGTAYRLPTLARRISGIESLSSPGWPTPRCANGMTHAIRDPAGAKDTSRLEDKVAATVYPTPTSKGNYNRKGLSAKSGNGLETAVRLWPTPNVPNGGRVIPKDANWSTLRTAYKADGTKIQVGLESAVRKVCVDSESPSDEPNGSSTQPMYLNPEWVEWLVGLPIGWTDLSEGG